jgi:hypothetical protein
MHMKKINDGSICVSLYEILFNAVYIIQNMWKTEYYFRHLKASFIHTTDYLNHGKNVALRQGLDVTCSR